MRVLTALDLEDNSKLELASYNIWMQIWHHDNDITDDSVLTGALVQAGCTTEEVAKYLKMTHDKAIKQRLIDVTEEANDAGAFGAPTFVIRQDGEEDKMFFGQGKNFVIDLTK